MGINIFLGIFQPREGEPNLWDLPTDYYLHHSGTRLPTSVRKSTRLVGVVSGCGQWAWLSIYYSYVCSHTKWWEDRLLASLPLPQLEGNDHTHLVTFISVVVEDEDNIADDTNLLRIRFDCFDEVYKTNELTDFDRLLSRSISRTGE